MKHWILCVIRFILSFVPKQKNKIFFESFPDYSDNARAFSDFLIKNTDFKIYWAVKNIANFQDTENITYVKTYYQIANLGDFIRYTYHTITSHFLISTHGAFPLASPRNQIFICCWHGMPFKRIAQMKDSKNPHYLDNANYILSTSSAYVDILAKCFNKPQNSILPIGYPRNDWQHTNSDVLQKLGIDISSNKLVLYLPTFRKPVGGGYVDSESDAFKLDYFNFTQQESLEKWNAFFKRLRITLIVKPHPSETNQLSLYRMSNIVLVPHSVFLEKDIQLNKVFYYADALITDFSGAFCDFLQLDRPIGFTVSDFESYKKNRGFVFDIPEDFLPGPMLTNEEDFIEFLTNVSLGKDNKGDKRKKLSKIYNDFYDNKNCSRLLEFLNSQN